MIVAWAGFAIGFVVTFLIVPWIIRHQKNTGMVGRDMNKYKKTMIPEMGGLAISAGFIASMLFYVYINGQFSLVNTLAAMSTVLIVTIVGIGDDLFSLRQSAKAALPLFAALPLMAIAAGVSEMSFPFIGTVNLGIIYPLIIIPLGITGAANATNMLAGFNGLEAGLGAIMHGTIFIVSLLVLPSNPAAIYSAVISATMLGALLAFLFYNWHPAKVFPGDVGTLVIGCTLATSVILGNMEKIGLILIVPFVLELAIKAKHRFKSCNFGLPQRDGTLKPRKDGGSLTHWVMSHGRLREEQVVLIFLAAELIFSAAAFISVYLQYLA